MLQKNMRASPPLQRSPPPAAAAAGARCRRRSRVAVIKAAAAAAAAVGGGGGGPTICIVGGGVAGLTTAVRVLDEIPGARVQVVAEAWGSDLASANAAGLWEPYKLSDTPPDLVYRWGQDTFEHLRELLHSRAAPAAGVSSVHATALFRAPEPDPFWAGIVGGVSRAAPRELELYTRTVDWRDPLVAATGGSVASSDTGSGSTSGSGSPAGGARLPDAWRDGYSFSSLICEGRLYLRWLAARVESAGGSLTQRALGSLDELGGEAPDAVVAACGLGARSLMPDAACYPIRGQIARVHAPWARECVFGHWDDHTTTYVIPNRGRVVVGGTGQVGDWRTGTDLGDADAILRRAAQLVPALADAEVIDHWVGLRPGRTSLRVDVEWRDIGGRRTPVVSNYGHGGAGLTLAWGTAGDAVKLLREALGV